MRRRDFIKGVANSAAAWPLAARAQQPAMPVIGLLSPASPDSFAHFMRAFRQGLKDSGYVEGENMAVDYRWAEGQYDRLPALAAELVRRPVAMIAATGGPSSALVAKAATTTIPIVFDVGEDPVRLGLVASLARPGGNITGLFYQQAELAGKKVELLTQALPGRTSLGILWDALVTDEFEAARHAAKALGLELHALKLEKPPYDFTAAFQSIAQAGAQMLLVLSSPFFASYRNEVAKLAIAHRLPAMFIFKAYVQAGGLMSYGVDREAMYRRTADYVANILKGTKPADLPMEQPTKFEFVINLKTAKALGITFPQSIQVAADEVIE